MCRWAGKEDWASGLVYSSTHVIGIGLRGECPHPTKCWLYFPEDDCPFYRCTVFSNYAPGNCPPADRALPTLFVAGSHAPPAGPESESTAGPYWSLMFEVVETAKKPVPQGGALVGDKEYPAVVAATVEGALATTLIPRGAEVVSVYHRRLEKGYPTPSLGR